MEARSVKIVVTCRRIEYVMNPLTCRVEKDKKKKKNKTFKRITKSVLNHNIFLNIDMQLMHNSTSHFCQHVIKFTQVFFNIASFSPLRKKKDRSMGCAVLSLKVQGLHYVTS